MQRYVGPDILRLLAAVLVVLFHLPEMGGKEPSWPVGPAEAPLGWLYSIAWMGWIGVQIFFVLSGFLIAASARNSTASNFLKKRAIRIFPALWISCVIALLARALWGEPFSDIGPSFLRSLVLSPMGPYIDGVVWTLVVEAVFYAVVAGALSITSGPNTDRGLFAIAFIMGCASTLFILLHWVAEHTSLAASDRLLPLLSRFVFDLLLLRHGVFFAVGILLLQSVENRPTKPVLAALAIFALAGCLQIQIMTGGAENPVLPITIWAMATVLLFVSVKYSEQAVPQGSKFSRPLGLLTYPLYLNHFVLGQALLPLLALWLPNHALLLFSIMALLFLNAWIISWGPERWLQRRMHGLLLGRAPKSAPTSASPTFLPSP